MSIETKKSNKVIEIAFMAVMVMTVFDGAVNADPGKIVDTTVQSSPLLVFSENFESGWGSWYADNGVWDVGNSTVVNCHGGSNCAATALNGNYPYGTNSRFISPSVQLPAISTGEEIHLRFWHWFSYPGDEGFGNRDGGAVQVSVYNDSTGNWENWQNVGTSIYSSSPYWSLTDRDFTQFAGKKIRIGFYHWDNTAYGDTSVSLGWYIDDIEITKGIPVFTGDFESGWNGWSADTGVWQVGNSTVVNCHGGFNCAGTVLNGTYPYGTNSRLISPSVQLPAISSGEEIHLRFWHWFSYPGDEGFGNRDGGAVQVSVYNDSTGNWENWKLVGNNIGGSSLWSLADRDLTQYAGKKIRIGFYHWDNIAYGDTSVALGWYIDDAWLTLPVSIQVTNPNANPSIILNDNGRARPSGTNITRLNVTVTGNVASVTIDLSSIGGSAGSPMIKISGTNIYTTTTNAISGINLTNNLVVNTTDTSGNFNNSVSISLTVLLRGDINGDGKIDLKDLLNIRRCIIGLCSINPLVADIQPAEGDGKVDLKDLLFLRRYLAGLDPSI